jgi:hypothetical protein
MKRFVAWIGLGGLNASLLLGLSVLPGDRSGPVAKVHAQEKNDNSPCSVASLNGAYGFYRSGTRNGEVVAAVGLLTFDGTGAVATARSTTIRNGVKISDLFTTPAAAGPYEVDPDCTGKFLNPDGSDLAHIAVVDGGKELYFTSVAPGVTSTAVAKRINSRGDHED